MVGYFGHRKLNTTLQSKLEPKKALFIELKPKDGVWAGVAGVELLRIVTQGDSTLTNTTTRPKLQAGPF